MVVRRLRIQARPNLASGAKSAAAQAAKNQSEEVSVAEKESRNDERLVESANTSEDISENKDTEADGQSKLAESTNISALNSLQLSIDVSSAETKEASCPSHEIEVLPQSSIDSPTKSILRPPTRTQSPLKSPIASSSEILYHQMSPRNQRARTLSTTSYCQLSPTKSDFLPRIKKKFTGNEPLDPKTMTMQDLIFWNPKNEKGMQERRKEKQSQSEQEISVEPKKDTDNTVKKPKPAFVAPQVKVAEDGSLILDDSSLTITNENDSSSWELVNESRCDRHITSRSFHKRGWSKGSPWCEMETDLFYEILRATGPDFALMHEFFPSRTRLELKSKFNREERANWDRLKQAMSVPTLLTESLYSHASEIIDKIKVEETKRKMKKLPKKCRSECNSSVCSVSCSSSVESKPSTSRTLMTRSETREAKLKEDLLGETAKEARSLAGQKKRMKRNLELNSICTNALKNLDEEFPFFEVRVDEDAEDVSVVGGTSGGTSPLVSIPVGTSLRVLDEDEMYPQRVLFECPRQGNKPKSHYVLQHQLGPGQTSSGFLHLFAASHA